MSLTRLDIETADRMDRDNIISYKAARALSRHSDNSIKLKFYEWEATMAFLKILSDQSGRNSATIDELIAQIREQM